MIRTNEMKLIYYLEDHITQMFDLAKDPDELHDVSEDPAYSEIKKEFEKKLIENLNEKDYPLCVKDGHLIQRDPIVTPYEKPKRDPFLHTLHLQRGIR